MKIESDIEQVWYDHVTAVEMVRGKFWFRSLFLSSSPLVYPILYK